MEEDVAVAEVVAVVVGAVEVGIKPMRLRSCEISSEERESPV